MGFHADYRQEPCREFIHRGVQLAIRAAVAAGLSVAIAQLFNLQYPIYAFLTAIIVTDLTPSESR